jgi:epoxyqueuosine reductase QueG
LSLTVHQIAEHANTPKTKPSANLSARRCGWLCVTQAQIMRNDRRGVKRSAKPSTPSKVERRSIYPLRPAAMASSIASEVIFMCDACQTGCPFLTRMA